MKDYKFTILFTNGDGVTIYAGSKTSAAILACAEQIKEGRDTKIQSIVCLELKIKEIFQDYGSLYLDSSSVH